MLKLHRAPLLPCDLFVRDINYILWHLCEYAFVLLRCAQGTLFTEALQPYASWALRGNLWQDSKTNVFVFLEFIIVAIHLVSWTDDVFLSPALFENHMMQVPGFQSFRSKEVWLDGFSALLRHPFHFSLDPSDTARISTEMLTVGEMGPGPRRLLRWCVGVVVKKDPLRKQERQSFQGVHDSLFEYFQTRFRLVGVVQTYFAWCEASKAVTDLYTNEGILYEAYDPIKSAVLLLTEQQQYAFDADVNSICFLRMKFTTCLSKAVRKFPSLWRAALASNPPCMLKGGSAVMPSTK